MTTTDELAHIHAIAAFPDEDQPRLNYADWLVENPLPDVKCGKCAGRGYIRSEDWFAGDETSLWCRACNRVGTVRDDDSRALRAEFIRVQCEMHHLSNADPKNYTIADNDRRRVLRIRERELLTRADAWRTGVLAELVVGYGNHYEHLDNRRIRIDRYERGFPAAVSMPLAVFLRDAEKRVDVGECPKCDKGIIHHERDSTSDRECFDCDGTGRRTLGDGLAARLLREQPIARGGIRLSDQVPIASFDASDGLPYPPIWHWRDGRFPPEFYRHCNDSYRTAEAAHEALAAVVYQYAHKEAFGG